MKNSTFLHGMRSLTLTGLVCLASLAVSAQTKTKTSPSTQAKAKTTATASPAKAKTATAATAKPKTYSASSTARKSTAAATTRKAPAKTVASAAPVKPVETAAVAPAPAPEVASPAKSKKQTSAAFGGGSNVISFGLGLVHNLDYPKGGSRLMPLTFSYERGLNVAAGPGTIGVGGVFSYSHYKWGEGDYKWTVMYFGAKGAYHIDLAKNEKLDTYAGLNLGYARTKVNYDSYYYGDASEGEVKVGVLAGARYFFTESVGAHLELESGPMSHITLGLSYKF